ncbi:hypothetical protein QAD02_018060 [Eretmocerus hayati]|uniref:Uncharacterized protein n=1 Tax=Eretmocerus hayati TaxID=131215 RepID=A0ACC2PFP4_9HYME|nr:hypothetical protein QAD02_018060 [Eretmocerus hayati]
MSLKTKRMQKIFLPIQEQIEKLNELLINDGNNSEEMMSLKKLILDQLHKLAEKFESASQENIDSYKDMKKKITSIIEDFCTLDFNKKDEDMQSKVDGNIFDVLLEKFSRLLQNLEKTEVLPLRLNIEECSNYVKEMGDVKEIEDFQNIKELGSSMIDIFSVLQIYKKNLVSALLSDKLALYCCQLCSSFNMLIQVVKEQHQFKSPLYTCKKYVCERLRVCFESIMSILDASKPSDEDENIEQENNFVHRMDLVLDIVSDISNMPQQDQIKECNDLWLAIEEVFAHAMSIAQVCSPDSFKSISASCQTILTEYENLKMQLQAEPPDLTMNNLFINTLTDALYRLERKINISVLTLVMEVFSDPFGALKKLISICGVTLNTSERTKNDLQSAIEEFDQLSDKAAQIGKFAIACSRDKNRVGSIRNCLASFESLETELVPAISAFYLHPDREMRECVKLLTTQWQNEMGKFVNTVNLIIDSSAYCEIVLDDIQDRVSDMTNCLDNGKNITQAQVQVVLHRSLSLSQQINATVADIGQENIDTPTIMIIREYKAAIYEIDAASKKFLGNKSTPAEQLRVIKRCEILLKVIKRLLPILSSVISNLITINTNCSSLGKEQKDLTVSHKRLGLRSPSSINGFSPNKGSSFYIRTPYSVKSCKQTLTIQPANTIPRNESDLSVLIPYIQKGQVMRTEWSVMYKTPNTDKVQKILPNVSKRRNLSSVRQHLFSRDSFSQNPDIDLSSESLNLTNILEKLTELSDTLSSVKDEDCSTHEELEKKSRISEKSKNALRNQTNRLAKKLARCSMSGGGDAPPPKANQGKPKNIKKGGSKMNLLVEL